MRKSSWLLEASLRVSVLRRQVRPFGVARYGEANVPQQRQITAFVRGPLYFVCVMSFLVHLVGSSCQVR